MDADDLRQLTARVHALEAFNRRLRHLVVILLLVVASTVWMGQQRPPAKKKALPTSAVPKSIEAEQFLLKGPNGQVLASLGAGMTGPTLRLVGPNGTDRAVLGLDAAGTPHFSMFRTDGSQAVAVIVGQDGVPAIEVATTTGAKVRLAAANDSAGMSILDEKGAARLGLDLTKEGPAITLSGADKHPLATFSASERGPEVALFDPDARSRITLIVRNDQALFGIRDLRGDVRVGLEVRGENPALGLYGPNGKPIFVKP